jgi:tellurium resistance protein TerZ
MPTLNLIKGQKLNLKKDNGSALTNVTMGLGWEPASTGFLGFGGTKDIDLDASCLMFDDNNNLVDNVWFRKLKSSDGSIVHSGDNLTGEGAGDDETIVVKLDKVPANIKTLVFTINSYRGQTFNEVKDCFCRLFDTTTKEEYCRFNLAEKGNHTGKIMARVYRHNGEWKISAEGIPCNGRTFQDMLPDIQQCL